MEEMKVDLHVHSRYSFDSFMDIEKILRVAKRKGLAGIAITDHNTVKGGLEAKSLADKIGILVICGAEIGTNQGEVLGLFLNKEIKSRNFEEVIDEIRSQGGLSSLPHPFRHKISIEDNVLSRVDAVEVFNARESNERNKKSEELSHTCTCNGITAGSDAHFYFEIGRGALELEDCSSEDDVKKAIMTNNTKFIGTNTHFIAEVLSQVNKAIKLRKLYPLRTALRKFLKNIKNRYIRQATI